MMTLVHRLALPRDSIWYRGVPGPGDKIAPHQVAHEDSQRTIWHADGGGFVGLVNAGRVAVRAETIQGVIELAEKLP